MSNLEISKIEKQVQNTRSLSDISKGLFSESWAKTEWSAISEHINISMKVRGGLESSWAL